MKSYLSCVSEWHERFQVPSPKEPTLTNWQLRCRLLLEEKDEFVDAVAAGDRVAQLDALCDLQYVLSGAILMLGLTEHYLRHTGEHSPECEPARVVNCVYLAGRAALLGIKVKYFGYLCDGGSINGAVSNLSDQQGILSGLIVSCGFERVFEDAFMLVHANNMAKLWRDEWRANFPSLFFSDAPWKPGMYIAKDEGGKVVKPMNHPKVDLTRLVAAL